MKSLMTLPAYLVEKLETSEMILVNGGFSSILAASTNNDSGKCDGTNNGDGKCSGTNNSSGKCELKPVEL